MSKKSKIQEYYDKQRQQEANQQIAEQSQEQAQIADFSEIGTTGLRRFGGDVYEEFLPHLRWPRAAKVYQEMENNDPVIGAVLHIIEQLLRRTDWYVESASSSDADRGAKEFLISCMHDMSNTWDDMMAEIITMIPYGFAWHEEVYKKREGDSNDPKSRSKYDDGRIGWRKIAGRSQVTLEEWIFDDQSEDGGLVGVVQNAPPDFKRRVIPLEKSLLFRTKSKFNNPEGRSLLRNTYRPWYFKKHIEEIEGIGIERDLAGLPVLTPPENVDIWNPHDKQSRIYRQQAEYLVRNIRRDQNEGIVKPHGWELELLSSASRRQFDTNEIINRYDQRIAITLLADIIMLGADKVGSFALADVKQGLLAASLEAILDSITEVFNRHAIPKLFKLNSFPGITDYPKLKHGKVITPSLTELARYIQSLAGAEMPLFPDDNLEDYIRAAAGLPKNEATEEERHRQLATSDQARRNQENGDNNGGANNGDGRLMNEGEPQEVR